MFKTLISANYFETLQTSLSPAKLSKRLTDKCKNSRRAKTGVVGQLDLLINTPEVLENRSIASSPGEEVDRPIWKCLGKSLNIDIIEKCFKQTHSILFLNFINNVFVTIPETSGEGLKIAEPVSLPTPKFFPLPSPEKPRFELYRSLYIINVSEELRTLVQEILNNLFFGKICSFAQKKKQEIIWILFDGSLDHWVNDSNQITDPEMIFICDSWVILFESCPFLLKQWRNRGGVWIPPHDFVNYCFSNFSTAL